MKIFHTTFCPFLTVKTYVTIREILCYHLIRTFELQTYLSCPVVSILMLLHLFPKFFLTGKYFSSHIGSFRLLYENVLPFRSAMVNRVLSSGSASPDSPQSFGIFPSFPFCSHRLQIHFVVHLDDPDREPIFVSRFLRNSPVS